MISVTGDTYPDEVSWELACDDLYTITGGAPYSMTHAVSEAASYTVLTTNDATCGTGLEVASLTDCSAAIAAANAAIGMAGYGEVSAVSYSFKPKGCSTVWYTSTVRSNGSSTIWSDNSILPTVRLASHSCMRSPGCGRMAAG